MIKSKKSKFQKFYLFLWKTINKIEEEFVLLLVKNTILEP